MWRELGCLRPPLGRFRSGTSARALMALCPSRYQHMVHPSRIVCVWVSIALPKAWTSGWKLRLVFGCCCSRERERLNLAFWRDFLINNRDTQAVSQSDDSAKTDECRVTKFGGERRQRRLTDMIGMNCLTLKFSVESRKKKAEPSWWLKKTGSIHLTCSTRIRLRLRSRSAGAIDAYTVVFPVRVRLARLIKILRLE